MREGGVNGTTNSDRTNYFATVPSANLETLLWLESDRLATLLDDTDQKKLDNQRDVVKNERRQGFENPPYGRALELLRGQLLPGRPPLLVAGIGSMEDLSAASLDDVKEFFRRYYTPNNLSLVIAGDFDPAEAKRLVEKYFGGLPPGPALDRPRRWLPDARRRARRRSHRSRAAGADLRRPRAGVLRRRRCGDETWRRGSSTDGLSSRLNKALVYDKPLAPRSASASRSQRDRRRLRGPRDGARRRRARRTSSGSSRSELRCSPGPGRRRPSSIARAPSRSSSSSPGSSASAASAARPIC